MNIHHFSLARRLGTSRRRLGLERHRDSESGVYTVRATAPGTDKFRGEVAFNITDPPTLPGAPIQRESQRPIEPPRLDYLLSTNHTLVLR